MHSAGHILPEQGKIEAYTVYTVGPYGLTFSSEYILFSFQNCNSRRVLSEGFSDQQVDLLTMRTV